MLKNHLDLVKRIEKGDYPGYDDDVLVELDDPFVNDNGTIQNLFLGMTGGSAVIHSKKHSIRANHTHRWDWHFSYLISGELFYYWQIMEHEAELKKLVIKPGQAFFTPPNLYHAMAFTQDSVLITVSKLRRTHDEHEEDVERYPLIDSSVFDQI